MFKLKSKRKARTLAREVSFSGIGIHTGKNVSMKFCPVNDMSGVFFKRVDLPGQPVIPATVNHVVETSRSTTIGKGDARVQTVEHVLAALRAYEIDNVCIEVDNIEPPIGNGSSDIFVEMIEEAGIQEQVYDFPTYTLQNPIYLNDDEIQIVALPSDELRFSYTLSYPQPKLLKAQFHSHLLSGENFKKNIAPCRTFSLYQEVSYLIDKGLIKGGSLDNAVVIHDDAVYSKGGLFFEDEMVRHKILDLIGDLSLVGFSFKAHIISIKSGHASNCAFGKLLVNAFSEGDQ